MTDGVFTEAPPAQEPADQTALLAKRLEDSQAFIKQLESENADMRNSLKAAEAEKEAQRIIEEARQKAASLPPSREATPASQEPAKPQIDEADLVERVIKAQQLRQDQEKQTQNAQQAVDRLVELFGTEDAANKVVSARAAELGVPLSFLLETAKASPNAFFDLMKLQTAPTQAPAPRGDTNSAAMQIHAPGVKEGTNAYYEKMRKEIGDAQYYTPKIQQQRFQDAKRLGDAFFQ